MGKRDAEFERLKERYYNGEISMDHYIVEYNALIEKESEDMQKSDPIMDREHI